MRKLAARDFNGNCKRCRRLVKFLAENQSSYPDYHNKPVSAFGDPSASLLIVGLAPGLHGANATGRPFTGDASGDLLFKTLHKFGLANRADSRTTNNQLQLYDCRITNAVKCLPPQNKPTVEEIKQCSSYLKKEFTQLGSGSVILALGALAHNAVLRVYDHPLSKHRFAHNRLHQLDDIYLLDSYHCSRYNINTKRLTETMFDDVFITAKSLLIEDKQNE